MKSMKKSIISILMALTMVLSMGLPAMAKVTYETAPGRTVIAGSTFTVTASTSKWNSVLNKVPSAIGMTMIEGDVGNASVLKYSGPIVKTPCPLYANYKEKQKSGHFDLPLSTASYLFSKNTGEISGPIKISATFKVLKPGNTTVTFKLDNRMIAKTPGGPIVDCSQVINVPVKIVQGVTSVKLNEKSATMKKGGTLSLKTTVAPKNAYNKKVAYSSSNPSVATVSSSGKVTAKKKGSAVITVKAQDGSAKKATCNITVK